MFSPLTSLRFWSSRLKHNARGVSLSCRKRLFGRLVVLRFDEGSDDHHLFQLHPGGTGKAAADKHPGCLIKKSRRKKVFWSGGCCRL
jgi:hypothetical protein